MAEDALRARAPEPDYALAIRRDHRITRRAEDRLGHHALKLHEPLLSRPPSYRGGLPGKKFPVTTPRAPDTHVPVVIHLLLPFEARVTGHQASDDHHVTVHP